MISYGEELKVAQLVVRNLEDEVKTRLRRRAARRGRSMEEEVRDILRDAVKEEESSAGGLGSGISSRFRRAGLKADVPELRGNKIKPPSFD
jgi:plasmid stability protein